MGELSAAERDLRAELERQLRRMSTAQPHEILEVATTATAAEVRSAFLTLTKRLHPNRFARHPVPIVRLANEIFLLVRSAYERASEPQDARELKPASIRAVELKPPTVSKLDAATSLPRAAGTVTTPPRATPGSTPPQPATDPPARSAGSSTPPQAAQSIPPSGWNDGDLRAAIAEKRRQRVAGGQAATMRPGSPVNGKTATTPATAVRGQPPTDPTQGRAPATVPPRTRNPPTDPTQAPRASGGAPVSLGRPTSRDDRVKTAERMLASGHVTEARAALRALVGERDEPRVRALLHLATGRELLAAGRSSDGRAELERAAAVDPSLAEAREALESFDKKDGGLFSRWFRK